MKESVVFYKSFYEAIKNIPKENQLDLYNAIFEYSFTGKEPKLDGLCKAMFLLMKENIDRANARYTASITNGKKGGRPKKNDEIKKPNKNLDETKTKPNENLNDNVNDNVNVNDNDNIKKESIKKESKFTKPTIELIQEYCDERNNGINANAFYDFYESKNWYVGKNKMKDWKACVRTWEQRNKKDDKKKWWEEDE